MKGYILIIVLCVIYSALFPSLDRYSKGRIEERNIHYLPDNRLLELSTLEFKNLASDIFFLNGLTFIGGRQRGGQAAEDWQWLYKTLDASSYLNPHNVDPYFLAQGFLTWDGKLYKETNVLLQRGLAFRHLDWRLPFFIGFNYYYFLDDPGQGASFITKAAEIPDSPKSTLLMLVSRLYPQSGRTEVAIDIMRDNYDKARDSNTRLLYKNRLVALLGRLMIEKAVETYQKNHKRVPSSLGELVSKKYLDKIPENPEGGFYFLDSRGKVFNSNEAEAQEHARQLKH